MQDRYTNELRSLHTDLSFCRELAPLFYSHLDFGKAALSLPYVRQALIRTYAAGESFSGILSSILHPLLRLWQG